METSAGMPVPIPEVRVPIFLKILSVIYYITAAISLIFGAYVVYENLRTWGFIGYLDWALPIGLLCAIIPNYLLARDLPKGRPSAKKLAIFLAVATILFNIFFLIIFRTFFPLITTSQADYLALIIQVVVLVYLFASSRAKQFFTAHPMGDGSRSRFITGVVAAFLYFVLYGIGLWHLSAYTQTRNQFLSKIPSASDQNIPNGGNCGSLVHADVDNITLQENEARLCFGRAVESCTPASLTIAFGGTSRADGTYASIKQESGNCIISRTTTTSTEECKVPMSFITAESGSLKGSVLPPVDYHQGLADSVWLAVAAQRFFMPDATTSIPLDCTSTRME